MFFFSPMCLRKWLLNILFSGLLCACFPIVYAASLDLQQSKEYQVVLKPEYFVDMAQGVQQLQNWLEQIEDNSGLDFTYKSGSGEAWNREVFLYDSAELDSRQLKFSVEQHQEGSGTVSKLKLKYNCIDPDVCYQRGKLEKAFSYPEAKNSEKKKIKLELDMHQNYTKYGLSGSAEYAQAMQFSKVAEIAEYFPQVLKANNLPASTPLTKDGPYAENVFDNMKVKFAGVSAEAALVARYANGTNSGTPSRVEFSFKIKEGDEGWEQNSLVVLGQVYALLLDSDWNADKGQVVPGYFYPPTPRD